MSPVAPTGRLTDIADHAARMDLPLVTFRQVAAASRSPPPAPAFLFGPFAAETARAMYGQTELPEIGVYSMADAAASSIGVAPTGIPLAHGHAFHGAALNLPRDHVSVITSRMNQTPLPARFVPGPLAVLFGPAEEAYAQLIIDYLPRLWLLQAAGYDPATIRYLVPATLPPTAEEALVHLSIRPDQLIRYAHWQEVITTDHLLLPTILRRHDRLSPHFAAATGFWTGQIPHDRPIPGTRLFLPSPHTQRLAAIAQSHGFTVARPATLDFPARAALFAGASHIIAPTSPGLLDTVFCSPGLRLLVLQDTTGFVQTSLGAALGHTTGYCFGDAGHHVDEADFGRALDMIQAG
jgi:capsular polysaccharide biosynthesis protein